MNFKYFLKEVLRGKTLNRALLSVNLKQLFHDENWLDNEFSILELGSEPASHQRVYPAGWKITKSNYKSMYGIDLVVNAEEKFSVGDDEFDGAVFFNILYLLDNYMNCLEESLRVAKRFVIFSIPLISGISPHPVDFNRFTEDRIDIIKKDLSDKFSIRLRVFPIGGSFTSAVSLIDTYLRFRIFRIPVYLISIWFDRLDTWIGRKCPVQYLVLISKELKTNT